MTRNNISDAVCVPQQDLVVNKAKKKPGTAAGCRWNASSEAAFPAEFVHACVFKAAAA